MLSRGRQQGFLILTDKTNVPLFFVVTVMVTHLNTRRCDGDVAATDDSNDDADNDDCNNNNYRGAPAPLFNFCL